MGDPNANTDDESPESALREASEAMGRAREALGRVAADLAAAGPLAALANARSLAASLGHPVEAPESADRAKRLVYHAAGVLDALGVLPLAVAAIVAEALTDYAAEPPAEG